MKILIQSILWMGMLMLINPLMISAQSNHWQDSNAEVKEKDRRYAINTNQHYQTIEGFGTSLINFGSMKEKFTSLYRTAEFQEFYVKEMGMNMLRCNLWGGVLKDPVEDWQDITYKDFDLKVSHLKGTGNHRDVQAFVDFAKGLLELNPDAKIIGTVWSPPAWMKMNNELTGTHSGAIYGDKYEDRKTGNPIDNRLKPKYYKHYAKYLAEWVKLFEERTGKPLYGISLGNEVMFTQNFGSCVWTAEDYEEMMVELGKMLDKEGYEEVKIYGPETMTSHNSEIANPMYVDVLTETPAAEYLDVFATHGYVQGVEMEFGKTGLNEFRKLINETGKPQWITEGGTGGHRWPEPLTGIASAIHNSAVYGNVEAFTPWQIAGGGPNTHCIMVYDQPTPKTYAAQHFFRYIDEGAIRVEASPKNARVKISAYLHPDNNKLTVVLINPGKTNESLQIGIQGEKNNIKEMNAWRTSETERMRPVEDYDINNNKITMEMPGLSVVTLKGEIE